MKHEYHGPVGIASFIFWLAAAVVFFLTSMQWLTWLLLLLAFIVASIGHRESTKRGLRQPFMTLATLGLCLLSALGILAYRVILGFIAQGY